MTTPSGCAPKARSRICAAWRRSTRHPASNNVTGLNRGGDRQANCALHSIALVRMSHDQTTKNYVARRISEGKTKREAIRCLKRYIARDIYRILVPIITTKPST